MTAPRTPPVALPYTPAVAPQKKWGTTPGIITVVPVKTMMIKLTIHRQNWLENQSEQHLAHKERRLDNPMQESH